MFSDEFIKQLDKADETRDFPFGRFEIVRRQIIVDRRQPGRYRVSPACRLNRGEPPAPGPYPHPIPSPFPIH